MRLTILLLFALIPVISGFTITDDIIKKAEKTINKNSDNFLHQAKNYIHTFSKVWQQEMLSKTGLLALREVFLSINGLCGNALSLLGSCPWLISSWVVLDTITCPLAIFSCSLTTPVIIYTLIKNVEVVHREWEGKHTGIIERGFNEFGVYLKANSHNISPYNASANSWGYNWDMNLINLKIGMKIQNETNVTITTLISSNDSLPFTNIKSTSKMQIKDVGDLKDFHYKTVNRVVLRSVLKMLRKNFTNSFMKVKTKKENLQQFQLYFNKNLELVKQKNSWLEFKFEYGNETLGLL